ncbi:MAG: hypothetical protein Q9217_004857 [Psora testacea]
MPSPHQPNHHHKPHKSDTSVTAAPIMTGPSGVPSSTYNGTAEDYSTGHFLQSTAEANVALPSEYASPDTAPGQEEDRVVDDESCRPATVTVTTNPTVTATAGGGPVAVSSLPANMAIPGPSNPELPLSLPIPSTSATQAAQESTPPKTQPKSVESSPQVEAETEPTQSPDQASSSSSAIAEPSSQATAAAAAPSTVAAAPAAGLKTKRGIIASGDKMNALAKALGNTKVSWLGNWYSAPPPELASSMTFVPQNYGKQSDIDGEWTKNAEKAVAAGAKYMLSFGEPGTPNDKLQMNPQQAVELWMEKMEPYAKQGVTIGAPGTLQNTQDFKWLSEFLDACTQCTIGFIAMHWYDKADPKNVAGFKETLAKAADLAKGKPIWLDNFQADGEPEAQQAFLREVVPWLDSQDNIQAYAYVPKDVSDKGGSTGFVDAGGNLNALGQLYSSL